MVKETIGTDCDLRKAHRELRLWLLITSSLNVTRHQNDTK